MPASEEANRNEIRVALDATPLLGDRTGIGEVVGGIIQELASREGVAISAYALTLRGRRDLQAALPNDVESATRPIPARWVRRRWLRSDSPSIERWTGPIDVVHATNYVAPPAKAPVIVSVYDLTVLRFPELCRPDTLQYPALLKRALQRGAILHAPSHAIAEELMSELGAPADRVVTIPLGLPHVYGGDLDAGRVVARAERYVLTLGSIDPRKNLPGLVDAFNILASNDASVYLVHAGPSGWDDGAFESSIRNSPCRDRIRVLGYVDADTRADLLAGASVFAYPSLYEGFGFPPLEAMATGVPVVATSVGSLPEVLGDGAFFVEADDPEALASALAQLLSDSAMRERLIQRGLAISEGYSWPKTADALISLYRSLA
ncbi:glycosyltransferase [Actinobacteria bacterium IMCC26256]|nr:glycosyltransferase [Actinobacteria bacterium IMCC26256]